MKSILISIQPKHVQKICNGNKTIEVRKTRPKIETPFKCYIYCTKGDALAYPCLNHSKFDIHRANNGTLKGRQMTAKEREQSDHLYANGKVIGEFTCDKIDEYLCKEYEWEDGDVSLEYHIRSVEGRKTCLEYDEIREYGNEKPLYFWHISDLKIYNNPRELGEFANYNKYQVCKERNCFSDNCWICDNNALVIRPPQSWQFIESLG